VITFESLILKNVDVDSLALALADIIAKRIEPMLVAQQRRLVDRPTMAKLANIGTATLDRLVASKRIPSVLIGSRRLFAPDLVIEALTGGTNDVPTMWMVPMFQCDETASGRQRLGASLRDLLAVGMQSTNTETETAMRL
jgi:hypothetical protein